MINITHLISTEIPKNGFERLFFFTEKNGKFFWGTDNNTIGSINIERWMKDGSVVQLVEPILINDEESFLFRINLVSWIFPGVASSC